MINQLHKKYLAAGFATILALAFVVSGQSKALTMDELMSGQQVVKPQGRVLGTATYKVDINGDGLVNSMDAAILLGHLGQDYPPADLNGDGLVNSLDFSVLSSLWFATKQ